MTTVGTVRTVRNQLGVKNVWEADGRYVIRLSGPSDLPYRFGDRVLRNSTPDSRPGPVSPQDRPGRALAHASHRSGDRWLHTPRGLRNAGRHGRSGTVPPVPGRSAIHLALCALCCALFALVTWQVAVDGPLAGADVRLGNLLQRTAPPAGIAEFCADLGNPAVALPVLAAAMTYAVITGRARRWLPPLCAALAMAGTALAVTLVKLWLGRPGPPGGTNYYPSGHTATAAVAFGGAALLFSMTVRRPPYWPLPATAALLTLACSAGLVWRGYHWPLDVVASWCLSWVALTAATAAVLRGLPRTPSSAAAAASPAADASPPADASPSQSATESPPASP